MSTSTDMLVLGTGSKAPSQRSSCSTRSRLSKFSRSKKSISAMTRLKSGSNRGGKTKHWDPMTGDPMTKSGTLPTRGSKTSPLSKLVLADTTYATHSGVKVIVTNVPMKSRSRGRTKDWDPMTKSKGNTKNWSPVSKSRSRKSRGAKTKNWSPVSKSQKTKNWDPCSRTARTNTWSAMSQGTKSWAPNSVNTKSWSPNSRSVGTVAWSPMPMSPRKKKKAAACPCWCWLVWILLLLLLLLYLLLKDQPCAEDRGIGPGVDYRWKYKDFEGNTKIYSDQVSWWIQQNMRNNHKRIYIDVEDTEKIMFEVNTENLKQYTLRWKGSHSKASDGYWKQAKGGSKFRKMEAIDMNGAGQEAHWEPKHYWQYKVGEAWKTYPQSISDYIEYCHHTDFANNQFTLDETNNWRRVNFDELTDTNIAGQDARDVQRLAGVCPNKNNHKLQKIKERRQ